MIPDYQSLFLPLLEIVGDGREYTLREVYDILVNKYKLTESERKKLLPSGQQEVFYNRVGWARTYLKKAGLLEYHKRGYFKITERGKATLSNNLSSINNKYLTQFKEFKEFKKIKHKKDNKLKVFQDASDTTPAESLESAYQYLRNELATELLEALKKVSPSLFEKIVVELLVKMGYGGSLKDAGRAIGKSGDEGIDGIINEDRLGLDVIYIQAKRWANNVGRPDIQKFAGALQGKRAHKGVFITTATFSSEAHEYASHIGSKIVLIDGEQLAQLMMDYNLGVSRIALYEVKRIDLDYFSEL